MHELPNDTEVTRALVRLRARVETLGVRVIDDDSLPDHARFIGLFEGHTITLFPQTAPPFARWFTVAHLYGHMTQMTTKNPRVVRANALVLRLGELLTAADVQLLYDHEREAAEIGRALVVDVAPELPRELDIAYSRFFHADFRYLINVIETTERGPELFARYWRREPSPRELITPDKRPLLDLRHVPITDERIIVV